MTEIQKEYCKEKGLIYIKPENTEIADYVSWLEEQILTLRIHDVVQAKPEKVCKGSMRWGTGCGKCKRCKRELKHL